MGLLCFCVLAQAAVQPKIVAGFCHNVALRDDGSLYGWGCNDLGQLGDGTTTPRPTVVRMGTDSNWAQLAGSVYHTLAIKADGSLWAWGYNDLGQLGTGNTKSQLAPVRVGNDSDWRQIAAGQINSRAIKTDGSLWAWGSTAQYFPGGYSRITYQDTPARIGNDRDWAHVAAGYKHTVAIKTDGSLWAWGHNSSGQLGVPGPDQEAPLRIGSDNDWALVASSGDHTVALKTNGSLWTWGYNREGQLGNGSFTGSPTPVRIGNDSTWAQVAASFSHTLAIKSDGSLWAWGDNSHGQLGDNSTSNRNTPVRIGSDQDWAQVAGGGYYTLAMKTDGTLWAWGRNDASQLGDGNTNIRNTPVPIGSDHHWAQVAAGNQHTVAIKTDGKLWAWGANESGQLGDGSSAFVQYDPVLIGSDSDWAQVAAGAGHTMALKTNGSLWAWGNNSVGQLGFGKASFAMPTPVRIGSDSNWGQIAASSGYTLGLKTDGSLWAWGDNSSGRLGLGNTTFMTDTPIRVGSDNNWAQVTAGHSHAAAVKTDGSLWAWGNFSSVPLSNGIIFRYTPVRLGSDSHWVQVAAGGSNTLVLKTDGSLWALSNSKDSQLVILNPADRNALVRLGNDSDWAKIAAGNGFFLARKTDGSLWAWGFNNQGQLGNGNTTTHNTPARIGINKQWAQIAAGNSHALAVKTDGSLFAWGFGGDGQLGIGSDIGPRLTPGPVSLAARNSPSFTSLPGGTAKNLTLTATIGPKIADVGNPVRVYVAAFHPDLGLFFSKGGQFQPAGSPFPVHQTLNATDHMVVNILPGPVDLAAFSGLQIVVGYGSSEEDLLAKQQFQVIYTVP